MDKYLLLIVNNPSLTAVDSTLCKLYDRFSNDSLLTSKINAICTNVSLKVALLCDAFQERECEEFCVWREILNGESLCDYLQKSIEAVTACNQRNIGESSGSRLSVEFLMQYCMKLMDTFHECFIDLHVFIMNDTNFEHNISYVSWLNEMSLYFFYVYGANINLYSSQLDALSHSFKNGWNFLINFEWLDIAEIVEWLESGVFWRGVLRYYSFNSDGQKYGTPPPSIGAKSPTEPNSNSVASVNENVATLFRVETDDENLLKLLDNSIFCPFGLIHYDLENGSFLESHINYDAYFQLQFEDNEPFLATLFDRNFFLIELHFLDIQKIEKRNSLWPAVKKYFQTNTTDNLSKDPRLTIFNEKLYCLAKKFENIEIRCFPLNFTVFSKNSNNHTVDISELLSKDPSFYGFGKENDIKLCSDYGLLEKIDIDSKEHPNAQGVLANSHKTLLKCASFGASDSNNATTLKKKRVSTLAMDVNPKANKLVDGVKQTSRAVSADRKLLTQIEAVLQRKHHKVDPNSALYKRCRKKLFVVCKAFVTDLDESSPSYINEVYQIVKQNVAQVVKFESSKK